MDSPIDGNIFFWFVNCTMIAIFCTVAGYPCGLHRRRNRSRLQLHQQQRPRGRNHHWSVNLGQRSQAGRDTRDPGSAVQAQVVSQGSGIRGIEQGCQEQEEESRGDQETSRCHEGDIC